MQNTGSTNGQVALPVNRSTSGVGMSKQELMKYANDPFWVRLRLFLFVLFWIVWLAMLVGAVVIVALAPGCPATASLPWWNKMSFFEVSIASEDSTPLAQSLKKSASNIKDLTSHLEHLHQNNMNTIVIAGLDAYLFENGLDNQTAEAADELKSQLSALLVKAHSDELKAKVIVKLNLAETSTDSKWFKESSTNNSLYEDYYIWMPSANTNLTFWDYNMDRSRFYARINKNSALLNFANENVRAKVKQAVLSWVHFKVDGIQVNGSFWASNSANNGAVRYDEMALQVQSAVKSSGKNKAFLMVSDGMQSDSGDISDLSADTTLWQQLTRTSDVRIALENIFDQFVGSSPNNSSDSTEVGQEAAAKNVGQNWKSHYVEFAMNENNAISQKHGLQIANAVMTAFHLMPKSTPIVRLSDGGVLSEQLHKLATSSLLSKLIELRTKESDSFLLGDTYRPKVTGSSEVSAFYRSYKQKNGYLLLINYDTTSKEVKLDQSTLPDIRHVHSKRMVLTDSTGEEVDLDNISLKPKQMLLVEFSTEH